MSQNREFTVTEITAYHHQLHKNNYVCAGHRHMSYELNVVFHGEVEATCDKFVFRLSAGDFMLLPGDAFHQSRVVGDDTAEMITVNFIAPALALDALPIAAAMTENQQAVLQLFCSDMEREWPEKPEHEVCGSAHKLFEVFLEYVSIFPPILHEAPDEKSVLYQTAVSYLTKNLQEPLHMDDIVRSLQIRRATLKEVFFRYAGMGCMEYFERLRLSAAIKMIAAGKSCGDVAKLFGFSSQAYFTKRFRLYYHMPPSKYLNGEEMA